MSLHVTDTYGDHEFATQTFSPVPGQGSSQTFTIHTYTGPPDAPDPVIARGDWYGRAVLSSKAGTGKLLAGVNSTTINAACRAL